jgi:hypothetical protein
MLNLFRWLKMWWPAIVGKQPIACPVVYARTKGITVRPCHLGLSICLQCAGVVKKGKVHKGMRLWWCIPPLIFYGPFCDPPKPLEKRRQKATTMGTRYIYIYMCVCVYVFIRNRIVSAAQFWGDLCNVVVVVGGAHTASYKLANAETQANTLTNTRHVPKGPAIVCVSPQHI